jgi:hypothetical protein
MPQHTLLMWTTPVLMGTTREIEKSNLLATHSVLKLTIVLLLAHSQILHSGDFRPPLGIHCLKMVAFIVVLLRHESEVAWKELVVVPTIITPFSKYPFNNMWNVSKVHAWNDIDHLF